MTGTESGRFDDLPPSARYVLRALDEAGGELSRSDLVDELCHRDRTITEALDTLENRGYILRNRKSEDLREVSVVLADERTLNHSWD